MNRDFTATLCIGAAAILSSACAPKPDVAGAADPQENTAHAAEAIIGGTRTTIGANPWMAAIKNGGIFDCGGVIINNRYVITSRSCVAGEASRRDWVSPQPRGTQDVQVSVGSANLTAPDAARKTLDVEDIIFPAVRDVASSGVPDDVALLRLKNSLTFSSTVGPIALATAAQEATTGPAAPGRVATLTGWGFVSGSIGTQVERLRQVSLTLLSTTDADAALPPLQPALLPSELATRTNGMCLGDAGGPLVVRSGTQNYLVGVASWFQGACDTDYPSIFTRVSFYNSFITSVISVTPTLTTLASGLSGDAGAVRVYSLNVPARTRVLTLQLNGDGNADLFANFNAAPTASLFRCKSINSSTSEGCVINAPEAGRWQIAVVGTEEFSDAQLVARTYSM